MQQLEILRLGLRELALPVQLAGSREFLARRTRRAARDVLRPLRQAGSDDQASNVGTAFAAQRRPFDVENPETGFTGLLTTFCEERGATAIVKGLRAVSDYEYELQMAQMNASLTSIETVFVPTSPEWSFLASSLVKEVAAFGGDVSRLVPDFVLGPLTEKLAARAAQ